MQGTATECIKLQALAAELAKDVKTDADLNARTISTSRR